MNKIRILKTVIILMCAITLFAQTSVEKHGLLTVDGNKITDKNGIWVSFAGNSFFWSNTGWGGNKYYNQDVVAWLKNDWDTKIVRAAIGVEGSGAYLSDSATNMQLAIDLVDATIAEGIYVLIDWHTHNAEDNEEAAIAFFKKMATRYGTYENVIYEIYNEPLQVSWAGVIKPYALNVISEIRAIDPDNMIIVGTPNWSQDVDVASASPITEYSNIAYALHFYAGTHMSSYRGKAQVALNNGIALMVTEWGTVNSNGDGAVNITSTNQWMNFLKTNGISHLNWAVNDKEEGASILNVGGSIAGGWSENDLTASGKFVKNIVKNWGTGFIYPEVEIANTDLINGSIINIELSKELIDTTVKINDFEFYNDVASVLIDSVVINHSDSKKLLMYLNSAVQNTDDSLTVEFTKGSLTSTDGLKVQSFTQKVYNLLPGAAPEVITAYTDSSFNIMYLQMTKKMNAPDVYIDSFQVYINSVLADSISAIDIISTDSSIIVIQPSTTFFAEDVIWLSFNGENYTAKDGGILNVFDSVYVINSTAKNPVVVEAETDLTGESIYVLFSESLRDTSVYVEDFTITCNGVEIIMNGAQLDEVNHKMVVLDPQTIIEGEDTCILTFTAGRLISELLKPALAYGPDTVVNNVIPTVTIPGKVEAEDFVVNVGFQVETATDEGGGFNLGYTDAGDYLEYNIIVPYTDTFTIYYRVSALSSEGQLQLSVDGDVKDIAYIPVTGDWQNWVTICGCAELEAGLHTVRLTALTSLFNLNWFSFEENCNTVDGCDQDPVEPPSGINEITGNGVYIYPNPANDFIEVITGNEILKNLTIKEMNGRTIKSFNTLNNNRIDVSELSQGLYILEVVYGNDQRSYLKLIKE